MIKYGYNYHCQNCKTLPYKTKSYEYIPVNLWCVAAHRINIDWYVSQVQMNLRLHISNTENFTISARIIKYWYHHIIC